MLGGRDQRLEEGTVARSVDPGLSVEALILRKQRKPMIEVGLCDSFGLTYPGEGIPWFGCADRGLGG